MSAKRKELQAFYEQNICLPNEIVDEENVLEVWFRHSTFYLGKYGILFLTNKALRFFGVGQFLTNTYWFTYLHHRIAEISHREEVTQTVFQYCHHVRIYGDEVNTHQNKVLSNYFENKVTNWQIYIANNDEKLIPAFLKKLKKLTTEKQMFVAMPFHKSFLPVYDTIVDACSETQYNCLRIDFSSEPGKIDDSIRKEIQESDIVLVDFTNLTPNVMIEYGLAEAQDKTIVCIAQQGQNLPFDIASRRTIFYEHNPKGLETLKTNLMKFFLNHNR